MPSRRSSLQLLFVTIMILGGLFTTLSNPAATAQSNASVTIQGFAFNPGSITVVIGVNNTVTWTNKDSVTHTVTADDGSFGSAVPAGGTYTHTFETAGVFSYHCSIHKYMQGTVTVLGGSSSVTSSTVVSSTSVSTSASSTSTASSSASSATSSTSTTTASTSRSTTGTQTTSTQTSSSTTSSALSSSSTQVTSDTSSGQVSGIPEFPFTAAGIIGVTALLVGAYLAARNRMGSRSGPAA